MTQLYSLSARLNYIVYNVMMILALCGLVNHMTVRYGHHIGLRDGPLGLQTEKINFELRSVDQFLSDRYFKEEALSFTFDLDVDLTPIINWNTHTLFMTLVCEYSTDTSPENSVTVWDQRVSRTATDHHQIKLSNEHVEYYLTDINKELKKTQVKIFLRFEHMSTIGSYYGD